MKRRQKKTRQKRVRQIQIWRRRQKRVNQHIQSSGGTVRSDGRAGWRGRELQIQS